jgi:DNA topoisomerase-1
MRVSGLPRSGEQLLPGLSENQKLAPVSISPTQHFTQPPPRFTEASLVKALEAENIGRPSTYATIIQTIQDRQYVRLRVASDCSMTFENVLCRVHPNFLLEVHLDTDEGNACNLTGATAVELTA